MDSFCSHALSEANSVWPGHVTGGASSGQAQLPAATCPICLQECACQMAPVLDTRQQEDAYMGERVRQVVECLPGQPLLQIALVQQHARLAASKGPQRPSSEASKRTSFLSINDALVELMALNPALRDLTDLKLADLLMVFQSWKAQGKSPAMLRKRFTGMRRFYRWIGQPELPTLCDVLNEKLEDIHTVGKVSEARDLRSDVQSGANGQAETMAECCEYTAVLTAMRSVFQLSLSEALRADVIKGDRGDRLIVLCGKTSNKERAIQLNSPEHLKVLRDAQELAHPQTGLVESLPGSLGARRRHYHYMVAFAAQKANFVNPTGEGKPDSPLPLPSSVARCGDMFGALHSKIPLHKLELPQGRPCTLHQVVSQAAAAARHHLRIHAVDHQIPGTAQRAGALPLMLTVETFPLEGAESVAEVALVAMRQAVQHFRREIVPAIGKVTNQRVAFLPPDWLRDDMRLVELFAPTGTHHLDSLHSMLNDWLAALGASLRRTGEPAGE